jgi:hypothetical protein
MVIAFGRKVAMTPNPEVKRANTGGAHLCAHRSSGAPLFAPYLLR